MFRLHPHKNTFTRAPSSKSHLDWEHGDALGAVDTVPNAETSPVLGDYHITVRYPLDIGAETEKRGLCGALYVVQMELRKNDIQRYGQLLLSLLSL